MSDTPFLAMIMPVAGGRPDHSLPQPQPPAEVGGGPIMPPPGIWPSPGHPGQPLPPSWGRPPSVGGGPIVPPGLWPPPGHPDHSLPPLPPGIWGGAPPLPNQDLPVQPGTPEHPIELPPGTIWPPIGAVEGKVLILVFVPFLGFRWVIIDTNLTPEHPIAPTPPPVPQPK